MTISGPATDFQRATRDSYEPLRAPQGFVLARKPVVSGGCEDGDISTTD